MACTNCALPSWTHAAEHTPGRTDAFRGRISEDAAVLSQAIAFANDSWGGLCGSVWTASVESANRVGAQLICGYVWVNDHGATRLDLRAPFGGMKQSGFGREQGVEGIRAFQNTRAIAHLDLEALAQMAH